MEYLPALKQVKPHFQTKASYFDDVTTTTADPASDATTTTASTTATTEGVAEASDATTTTLGTQWCLMYDVLFRVKRLVMEIHVTSWGLRRFNIFPATP